VGVVFLGRCVGGGGGVRGWGGGGLFVLFYYLERRPVPDHNPE